MLSSGTFMCARVYDYLCVLGLDVAGDVGMCVIMKIWSWCALN